MESQLESLKSIARLKSLQPTQLSQTQTLAMQLEAHFESKIQSGSPGEGARINFVAGELQRVLQTCSTQKTPTLDDEMVMALKAEIGRFRILGQKAALVPEKAVNGGSATDVEMMPISAVTPLVAGEGGDGGEPGASTDNRPPGPAEAAWSDNESLDSEEAYELALREERKKKMGSAAVFLNCTTLLTLVIMILGCVAVGFVSSREFETYQENEHRNLLHTIANFISDGLTVIEASTTISSTASKMFLAEMFVNDLRQLRLTSTANRFEVDAQEPFLDIYARQMQYSTQTNELLFAENFSRSGSLLCLSTDSFNVIQLNDLDYGMVEPSQYLEARGCSAEPGGPVWRNTASVRASYFNNRMTYRGTYARQVSKIWPTLNLGFVVSRERKSFQDSVADKRLALTGPHNPLSEPWQQSSAQWVSIGLAVSLLCCVVIAEAAAWAVNEEHLSPFWAATAHVLLNGVVVVTMVAVASSIFWYFLREHLFALEEQNTRVLSRVVAAGMMSPNLLAALGNSHLPLVNRVISNSLKSVYSYSVGVSTTPNALAGLTSSVGALSLLTTTSSFVGGTKQFGSTRTTFAAFYFPSFLSVSTILRSTKVTVTVLDAGAYCGGVIMGSFGAQLLFGALWYLFSPLLELLTFAKGGVFLQKRFQPWNFRQVLYVFIGLISFGTSLALAFSAVHAVRNGMADVSSSFTDKAVVEAIAAPATQQSTLNNHNMPSFAETILFQLDPVDSLHGMPVLSSGQTLRYPLPAEPGWEKQNYAAAISLSNLSMTLLAPSYATPLASLYRRSVQSSTVRWKRITTTTVEPLIGVVLERDPASSDLIWKDYQVYVSFVAASVLSTALVCLLLEFCYRALANEYDPDNDHGDFSGLKWRVGMFVAVLLAASSVLIGAGAASRAIKASYDEYLDNELSWGVVAAKSIVEGRAVTASLSGEAAVVPAMVSLVNAMNSRTKLGMRSWARWVLLQESAPLDGSISKVRVVAGGDAAVAFTLPNLPDAMTAPVAGVARASVFFTNHAHMLRYAAVAVNSFIAQGTTPQPLYFLALTADREANNDLFENVLTDLYHICGAATCVLFLLFSLALWFTLDAGEEEDFVVFDPSILLQGVAEESESAPPTLPRETRLWHTIVYLAIAVILVFFCVSMLYGSSTVVLSTNEMMVLDREADQLNAMSLDALQIVVDFLVTGFGSMRATFEATLGSSSPQTLWGKARSFFFTNATSGAQIYQSMDRLSTGIATFASAVPSTFFADEMISNYYQTYHDATMQSKDNLFENTLIVAPITDLVVMLESFMEQMKQDLDAHNGELQTQSFNQSAVFNTMVNSAEAKEIILAILVLEKVALNTLLDYRQVTQSDSRLFELSANATVYLPLVQQVHEALVTRLNVVLANATSTIPDALAFDETWRDEALNIVNSIPAGLVSSDLLSNLKVDTVWKWQGSRLAELAAEMYGESTLIAAALSPLQATLKAAQTAMAEAVRGEEQQRLLHDGVNTATWKRSLVTLTQRLALLRALDDVFVTAIAVALVALLVVLVVYAMASYLVTHALIQHSAMQLTNAVAEPDDSRSSEDSSLMAAGERHHHSHARRLMISIAIVMVLCVPIGLTTWVARQGIDHASEQSVSATRAHRALIYLQQLDTAADEVLHAASKYYVEGTNDIQTSFDEFLNVYRQLEFLLRNGVWMEDRQYVNTVPANVAPADGPLYRAYVLRNELESIRTVLLNSITVVSKETNLYTLSQSSTTANFSAAYLPLQKIANSVLVRLQQAAAAVSSSDTLLAAWKDILIPLSGFSRSGSAIGSHVQAQIEDARVSIANGDPNSTVVPKLRDLQDLLRASGGVVEAEFLLWWFQTIGSNRNTTSSTGPFLQFAQLLNQSKLQGYDAASLAEVDARYSAAKDLLVPLSDAMLLFNSTPLMTTYASAALTNPDEWLRAAGASSTFFKTIVTTADFRAQYAVNRGLIPTSERYPVSFKDTVESMRSTMENLMNDAALSRLRRTQTKQVWDPTSPYRLSQVEPVPFGLQNAEYVHTAVQWVSVVTFWILFGSFLYFVVDLRLFST